MTTNLTTIDRLATRLPASWVHEISAQEQHFCVYTLHPLFCLVLLFITLSNSDNGIFYYILFFYFHSLSNANTMHSAKMSAAEERVARVRASLANTLLPLPSGLPNGSSSSSTLSSASTAKKMARGLDSRFRPIRLIVARRKGVRSRSSTSSSSRIQRETEDAEARALLHFRPYHLFRGRCR